MYLDLFNEFQHSFRPDSDFYAHFYCHLYAKDKAGKYLYANQVFIENSGFSKPNDILGLTDFDLTFLEKKDAQYFRENDQVVIQKNTAKNFVEPGSLFNRNRIIFISQKKPLRLRSDKIIGTVGISFILDHNDFFKENTATDFNDFEEKESLTKRQIDCLFYLTKGMTAKQIGVQLNISKRTVEQHFVTIKNKLDCKKRKELVEKALNIPIIKQSL